MCEVTANPTVTLIMFLYVMVHYSNTLQHFSKFPEVFLTEEYCICENTSCLCLVLSLTLWFGSLAARLTPHQSRLCCWDSHNTLVFCKHCSYWHSDRHTSVLTAFTVFTLVPLGCLVTFHSQTHAGNHQSTSQGEFHQAETLEDADGHWLR